MAIVEYKKHRTNYGNGRTVPEFIVSRGWYPNPDNNTYLGWVDDNPDYYVPDTLKVLTKEQVVARALAIHAAHPLKKEVNVINDDGTINAELADQPLEDMTEEEVRTGAEEWYDAVIAEHTTEE